jgi:NAD(P)-dependent dehydrogenase (short-subunit alcohol dehydrogenase family)
MPFSYHNPSSPLASRNTIDGRGFGKVAIITGCSSGVGLATTQLFLSHQFEVLGVDMSEIDYEKIDPRDQERLHFHRGDLAKEGECDEVVRICVAKFGWVVSCDSSQFEWRDFRGWILTSLRFIYFSCREIRHLISFLLIEGKADTKAGKRSMS